MRTLKLVMLSMSNLLASLINISVDSIRVSLLGGRILFKNLRYLSTNQSVSIVKGHIAFRYWLTNVRKSEDDKTGILSKGKF